MKGTPRSLWLSAANRVAGWWIGTAASAVRKQQRAAMAELTKAITGAKPKQKRRRARKRPKL